MKVSLGTIEVSDHERRALNYHYGDTGLATRDRVRAFVLSNGQLALEQDVCHDYDMALERHDSSPQAPSQ